MSRVPILRSVTSFFDLALPQAGLDLRRAGRSVRGIPKFIRQYREFKRQSLAGGYPPPSARFVFPILGEELGSASGSAGPHYLHQDLWAARKLFERRPAMHYDIGSRVDGFITSVLVFCPVTMIDIRPLDNPPIGLLFHRADAMKLPFGDASIDSISSLHAIEHFGLGRYGDPLCPEGAVLALSELARVMARDGRMYLGLPIGREKVMFNAQRVMSPKRVLEALTPLELISFSAVSDSGQFVPDADPANFEGASYSCGLFELTRNS